MWNEFSGCDYVVTDDDVSSLWISRSAIRSDEGFNNLRLSKGIVSDPGDTVDGGNPAPPRNT